MSEAYASDPVFGWVARLCLLLLFGTALFHKVRAFDYFAATLRSYDLVPEKLVPLAAVVIVGTEAVTTTALALRPFDPLGSTMALLLLALLAYLGDVLHRRLPREAVA